MINRDLRPRLDLSKMQTNVIMTQIRAEKQKNCIKIVEPILTPIKQNIGRKHFNNHLCHFTDISNQQNNEEYSRSKSTGKKHLAKIMSQTNIDLARQKSQGKKKFHEKIKKPIQNPLVVKKRTIQIPKSPLGRKRMDHSPNNQQRESLHSPLSRNYSNF